LGFEVEIKIMEWSSKRKYCAEKKMKGMAKSHHSMSLKAQQLALTTIGTAI
jgi:hypothetical protein